jgi:hypothetical protein
VGEVRCGVWDGPQEGEPNDASSKKKNLNFKFLPQHNFEWFKGD